MYIPSSFILMLQNSRLTGLVHVPICHRDIFVMCDAGTSQCEMMMQDSGDT